MELLGEHLGQWACSCAFPELAHLPLVQLRRFAKTVAVERFKAQVRPAAQPAATQDCCLRVSPSFHPLFHDYCKSLND